MKIIITKITSFLLAFLVLFSTFSFTVESHYCGDFLIDSSYLGEAEVCKSDLKDDFSVAMKDCCSDEVQKIEGQDELQILGSQKFDFKKQQLFTNLFFIDSNLFVEINANYKVLEYNSTPYIPINQQVLYQSFLI
ncbi:hypothetical protein SHK09_14385 [Polaribacter sp. PL03]|uniref:HYC_CC_PP family protein n=1 Tax=Polaribacter sp. PL03 TaxID=3088353 RepID=UPI0029CCAFDA|nr:hypothetical protein [Polaribacter sp. PL03]MDX6747983.1 hypothetical protein [Polaribacter sp. PL03]